MGFLGEAWLDMEIVLTFLNTFKHHKRKKDAVRLDDSLDWTNVSIAN